MKFTNAKAYDALLALLSVSETGRLGYAIAKNARKIRDEIQEYINKREGAVSEYGSDNGNGAYVIKPDDIERCLAEFEDLNDIECDIDIMTVDTNTFCSGNLTSNDMLALEWMEETPKGA